MPERKRLFYLDLVRAVALVCILIVHFNATVTGYFTLPHKIFTSTLPLGIYLGDFGSSLFFIVSGASLALTVSPEASALAFYKRRAKAVYPLFWLSWIVVFSVRFVTRPGSFSAAKTPTLLLTVLGLDQYAVAAGWVGTDFACVGEWFLGSILFLYLLFPLFVRGLSRAPVLTWCLAVPAACVLEHYFGWDSRLLAVHILEFLFGMSFLYRTREQIPRIALGGAALLLALALLLRNADEKLCCAAVSAAVFILLAMLAPLLERPYTRAVGAYLAQKSYAVFLLHHVIIQRMVSGFDLTALSRRDTAFLFGVYLLAVFAAAEALLWLYGKLCAAFAALRAAG